MIPRLPRGFSHPMRLGQGSSGTVLRVRQSALDRWVALKCMPVPESGAEELLREARLQGQWSLPGIPAVYDAFAWRNHICIVMRWVAGFPLDSILDVEWPLELRAHLATGLLKTVAGLHAAGFAHRDLKPANALCDEDGTVHLVDFGFTRRATQGGLASGSGRVSGTPAYMAPEVWLDTAPDWKRADVYSLGKTLRLLLPEAAGHPGLASALSDSPADRPADAGEMAARWAESPYSRDASTEGRRTFARGVDQWLGQALLKAGLELDRAGRREEAFWLISECLERQPETAEALAWIAAYPLRAREAKRRRVALTALATTAACLALVATYRLGQASREPILAPRIPVVETLAPALQESRSRTLAALDIAPEPSGLQGRLRLLNRDGWASLTLNGKALSLASPETYGLPPGRHVVEAVSDQGPRWRRTFEIRPFQEIAFSLPTPTLPPAPTRDSEP